MAFAIFSTFRLTFFAKSGILLKEDALQTKQMKPRGQPRGKVKHRRKTSPTGKTKLALKEKTVDRREVAAHTQGSIIPEGKPHIIEGVS